LWWPIDEGIVGFGEDPLLGTGSRSDDITVEEMPDAGDVQALLNLSDPGGYVVLFGSGCRIAEELAGKVDGVHFIGFNPPPELRETEYLSLIRSPLTVPLMDSCVRGVLVGQEYVRNRWLNEASRVLYGEGRLVAVFEQISPDRVKQLAVGNGMWVGEKEGVPGERAGGSGPSCAGR